MQVIIGELGLMGIRLNDKLNDFVEKEATSFEKIFKSLEVAMGELLAPFEESILGVVTVLGELGGILTDFNKGLSKITGGFLDVTKALQLLLLFAVGVK